MHTYVHILNGCVVLLTVNSTLETVRCRYNVEAHSSSRYRSGGGVGATGVNYTNWMSNRCVFHSLIPESYRASVFM